MKLTLELPDTTDLVDIEMALEFAISKLRENGLMGEVSRAIILGTLHNALKLELYGQE